MKRSTLIIAALAAFALSGCNMGSGGSSSTTRFARTTTTETVTTADGIITTYVTKFKYDQMGYISEETITKNGQPWRVTRDYVGGTSGEGHLTHSCTRVTTNDDGSTVTHNLVTTYGAYYYDNPLETKFEMFLVGGSASPVETRNIEYQGDQLVRYESWTVEGGTVTRTDFRYSNSPKPIETFTETRFGGSPVRVGIVATQYTADLSPLEYKMYRNVPENDWAGEPSETTQLIEERVDYTADASSNGWKIRKYDDNGELLSTSVVENEYENITFTLY